MNAIKAWIWRLLKLSTATHSKSPKLPLEAVHKLTDEMLLAKIAKTDPDDDFVCAAVYRLRELGHFSLLSDIIFESTLKTTSCDQALYVLGSVALSPPKDRWLQGDAAHKALLKIACEHPDVDVTVKAASRMYDLQMITKALLTSKWDAVRSMQSDKWDYHGAWSHVIARYKEELATAVETCIFHRMDVCSNITSPNGEITKAEGFFDSRGDHFYIRYQGKPTVLMEVDETDSTGTRIGYGWRKMRIRYPNDYDWLGFGLFMATYTCSWDDKDHPRTRRSAIRPVSRCG